LKLLPTIVQINLMIDLSLFEAAISFVKFLPKPSFAATIQLLIWSSFCVVPTFTLKRLALHRRSQTLLLYNFDIEFFAKKCFKFKFLLNEGVCYLLILKISKN
jgi:hypothetical protein